MNAIEKIAGLDNAVAARQTYEDVVRANIAEIAKTATDADRKAVEEMMEKAKTIGTEVRTLTPAQAALLFINANSRNRPWRARKSEIRAEQMKAGEWKVNGQTIQFYNTGQLGDGQHRLGGNALSGVPVTFTFFYGLNVDDIVTVDDGTRRTASDAMSLEGMSDAKIAEHLVKKASEYEVKAKLEGAKQLEGNFEVRKAVMEDHDTIKQAILIGSRSKMGISAPILSEKEATTVAYLFLRNGWDAMKVETHLHKFQTGLDESESSPMFRVSSLITKAKAKKNTADRLTAIAQIALVVKAFKLVEEGVGAVQNSTLKDIQSGKTIPNPRT